MSLTPWRDIARPHKDVLEGTFKQSEFAADISQVASGKAAADYQDAEIFFSRTYITEGMRLLLISVAQRLAGQGGDPVIQLQTAFGGGKTHAMLAVWHLASRQVSTGKLQGIPPILDEAGIQEPPKARIAVLDGINLSASQGRQHDATHVNTLWGELAWQLLGEDGYAMVADSDRNGTAPSKDSLIELLRKAAPCVLLIDELQKFFSELTPKKSFNAGTYESNLKFVQALTEALKAVPNAMLLATLPESGADAEVGGEFGQRALNALEKHFGRVESVWKPVGSEEAFEIIRRRLFKHAGDPSAIEDTSQQFADFYRAHRRNFPPETQSEDYAERLRQSYPIHPEVFDRLYEDWSTLDKFQRTRGVLQYMAIVIHHLWNAGNRDALIMPGSIVLDDSTVRNKSIHYLPQGWEPVIEKEVDGPRSEPHRIDADTRFGSVHAARRTMRTIFLGSAPAAMGQTNKGIEKKRILLGCAQPGQTIGVYQDALRRLHDKLTYLYSEEDRFWLDTKPNLRREMEGRAHNIDDQEQLLPELQRRVSRAFGRKHHFAGVHVFTPSADVADEFSSDPRLVVLLPEDACSQDDPATAHKAAEKILLNRGEQPRQKRNRLIFLAPDRGAVSRLESAGKTYLAWQSIADDVQDEKLDITGSMTKQVARNAETAERHLQQVVRDAYKWLICPSEEFDNGKHVLSWNSVAISPTAPDLADAIESKLQDEEWLIATWSPFHLREILQKWYWKNGQNDIGTMQLWQDICKYLYLPRLLNQAVLEQTINRGIESRDFFGFASAKEDDQYLGFAFGEKSVAVVDAESLIINRDVAAQYQARSEEKDDLAPDSPDDTSIVDRPARTPSPDAPSAKASVNKRFYGTISLSPMKAKMEFSDIVDEVVDQFNMQTDVELTISVEIAAKSKTGFNENTQRAIKENCAVLKFVSHEFVEDDE